MWTGLEINRQAFVTKQSLFTIVITVLIVISRKLTYFIKLTAFVQPIFSTFPIINVKRTVDIILRTVPVLN